MENSWMVPPHKRPSRLQKRVRCTGKLDIPTPSIKMADSITGLENSGSTRQTAVTPSDARYPAKYAGSLSHGFPQCSASSGSAPIKEPQRQKYQIDDNKDDPLVEILSPDKCRRCRKQDRCGRHAKQIYYSLCHIAIIHSCSLSCFSHRFCPHRFCSCSFSCRTSYRRASHNPRMP